MQRLGAGWAGRRIPPDLPVAVAKQVPAVTAGNARCAEQGCQVGDDGVVTTQSTRPRRPSHETFSPLPRSKFQTSDFDGGSNGGGEHER